jgi:hypothetical protein
MSNEPALGPQFLFKKTPENLDLEFRLPEPFVAVVCTLLLVAGFGFPSRGVCVFVFVLWLGHFHL